MRLRAHRVGEDETRGLGGARRARVEEQTLATDPVAGDVEAGDARNGRPGTTAQATARRGHERVAHDELREESPRDDGVAPARLQESSTPSSCRSSARASPFVPTGMYLATWITAPPEGWSFATAVWTEA